MTEEEENMKLALMDEEELIENLEKPKRKDNENNKIR
jgi:hypothetical protein